MTRVARIFGPLLAFVAVGCLTGPATAFGGAASPGAARALRAPTTHERERIAARVRWVWSYESARPQWLDEFFPHARRRPALHPVLVKARVLRAEHVYAAAVVVLHDRGGRRRRGGPWIVVLRRYGDSARRGRWSVLTNPTVDIPLACTRVTPAGVRALLCPSPWRVLGVRRPRVHVQTALTQPLPARDLHRVRWRRVALPGAACGASRPIRPRRHMGWTGGWSLIVGNVNLPWWNPVEVEWGYRPVFGDIDGDGRDEAAVDVTCDNGGGTADGQLEFSTVVFKADGNRLRALGVIPMEQPLDVRAGHVPVGRALRIEQGRVTTSEYWYGPFDGTCCGSGHAEVTWTYRHRHFTRTDTRILVPVWTSPVLVTDVLVNPGTHELGGYRLPKVPLSPRLRFDVLLENEGSHTRRNVGVTLTIGTGASAIIRSLTIGRIKPWAVDDTVLRFTGVEGLKPGRTTATIQIGLPGANPIRYPIRFVEPAQ